MTSYGEFMTMFAKTVAERTEPGVRQSVEEKQYTIHAYAAPQDICAIFISDPSYPTRVAYSLLSKMIGEFTTAHERTKYSGTTVSPLDYPPLKEYIVQYQNPDEMDLFGKIQDDLDEAKVSVSTRLDLEGSRLDSFPQVIIKNNIESVLVSAILCSSLPDY